MNAQVSIVALVIVAHLLAPSHLENSRSFSTTFFTITSTTSLPLPLSIYPPQIRKLIYILPLASTSWPEGSSSSR